MTRAIDGIMRDLAALGTAIVPDVLDPAATAAALERLWAGAEESERRGVSTRAETLDPNAANVRVWNLLDLDPVFESVRRTGRCVVVHEAPLTLGMGAEIAARVTETCFHSLEAPVLRVGGYDTPYPPSKLEEEYLPDLDRVLDAVDRSLGF